MKRINSNKVGDVWLYQRQQKGNWYYSLTLNDGKKVEKSLGTTNFGRATEMAKSIKVADNNILSDEGLNRPSTLVEALEQYITFLISERRQATTITRYKGIFKTFSEFCSQRNITKIEQLDQRLLNQFRMERVDKVKDSTRYYESERLVEFGSYLVSEGILAQCPFSLKKIRKAVKEPLPWFKLTDVEKILDIASQEDAKIFEFLAFTGLRIGELKRLRWSEINLEGGILTVTSTNKDPTKGKSSRVIPIHVRVLRILTSLKHRSGYIFTASKSSKFPEGGRPINKSGLSARLKRICKELEIPGCVHSFRKFFCSYMANKGVPVLTLKEWTGHKDIKVLIDSYYKLHLDDSLNFMKKVSFEVDENVIVSKIEGQSGDISGDNEELLEIK